MATVNSLSSQSSIYSLVSQLMLLERQPIAKLQTKRTDVQTRNAVFSDLKLKLSALRASTTAMFDVISSPLSARAVASSSSTVATATATSGAFLGAHAVAVTQLAKSHTMTSNQFSADGLSLRTALGVGDQTFSILLNGESVSVTVSIGEADTDADIITAAAAAINTALADKGHLVSATALADSATTRKLVLRSSETGAENKMTLADESGALLASLGIDDESVAATNTTGGYIYADSQLDAIFTLDGVNMVRSSNTVSDALNGVTLTLKAAQAPGDPPVDMTVSADNSSITSTIQSFITKYNDAVSYLRSKTAIDSSTGKRQALATESMYRALMNEMRTAAAGAATTGVAGVTLLSEIGVTQAGDGTLSLSDSTKLDAALKSAPAAVAALFNADDGVAKKVDTLLEPFLKAGGYLANDQDTITARIATINESITRLEAKMALREKSLIEQYSKLEKALAQLNGQQNYLGAFLATFQY